MNLRSIQLVLLVFAAAVLFSCNGEPPKPTPPAQAEAAPARGEPPMIPDKIEKVSKTDAEWKAQLTEKQYYVMRQKGTERAFTGEYWDHKKKGVYTCASCGLVLYRSETKFDSGCGWPSFFAPADAKVIEAQEDRGHLMVRTELLCTRCGAHLGHVFDDGPKPTGQRHCINSASLKFIEAPPQK